MHKQGSCYHRIYNPVGMFSQYINKHRGKIISDNDNIYEEIKLVIL